jgi:hypothetical protein
MPALFATVSLRDVVAILFLVARSTDALLDAVWEIHVGVKTD